MIREGVEQRVHFALAAEALAAATQEKLLGVGRMPCVFRQAVAARLRIAHAGDGHVHCQHCPFTSLVAIYVRPDQLVGGLLLPAQSAKQLAQSICQG